MTTRPMDAEIAHLEEGRVTFRSSGLSDLDEWQQDGVWGVQGERGYARVGTILDNKQEQVVREFEVIEGNFRPGERIWIDALMLPDDPAKVFGLSVEEVTYVSPLGPVSAYFRQGWLKTWVIFIHGKRDLLHGKPPYSYPILPVITELGLPFLDISYRNDIGAPESPDGFHWYGLTEWQDLEAAAKYAISQGAERLVLYGFSMGGGVAMSFLYRSDLADRVLSAVLDGPMLDLNTVIASGFRKLGLPRFLIEPSKFVTSLRTGAKWTDLNYLNGVEQLHTPLLLFHGDSDPIIPAVTSDTLARMRPDLITYVRMAGATHGSSWNVNREAYEEAVRGFLGKVLD